MTFLLLAALTRCPTSCGLVTDLAELAALLPTRPVAAVREARADGIEEFRFLHRPTQIPVLGPAIASLVIAIGGEAPEPAFARFAPSSLHVIGAGQRHVEQHGHAALGQREMVGAIE